MTEIEKLRTLPSLNAAGPGQSPRPDTKMPLT